VDIQIIQVPYDSGQKNRRMGNGPEHIVSSIKKEDGLSGIFFEEVAIENHFPLEIGTTLQVAQALAGRVQEAVRRRRFPIVLAGGCTTAIGTLAGLGAPARVLWLDAHGDFNTPDTTVSGFFGGMALATVTGRCWTKVVGMIPGFRTTPDSDVILLGAREFDSAERSLLETSAVTLITT
jgi:arginase